MVKWSDKLCSHPTILTIIRRMKFLFLLLLFAGLLFVFTPFAEAKTLPQSKATSGKSTAVRASGSGIGVSAKLRKDRKALLVSFWNLQNAKSVSYTLVYSTNGTQEGAGGSVRPSEGAATRELLFGTCSASVCRYHTGLSDMRLEVVTELKSGKIATKRFKIRI